MSIVTFDGQVLAADSRKTVIRRDAEGKKTYIRTTDQQVKIELVDGTATFRNERIEAVGRCGNLKLSSALIEDLKTRPWLGDVDTYWTEQNKLDNYRYPASLLIVTDRNAYHLRASPKQGFTVVELEHKPFAMGSGAEVAMFLMDTLKLPACEAAMAVTLKFKSCGGPIQLLKRDRWTGRLMLADAKCNTDHPEQRRLLVAQAILKSVGRLKERAERKLLENPAVPAISLRAQATLQDLLVPQHKPAAKKKVTKKKAVKQSVVKKDAKKVQKQPAKKKR